MKIGQRVRIVEMDTEGIVEGLNWQGKAKYVKITDVTGQIKTIDVISTIKYTIVAIGYIDDLVKAIRKFFKSLKSKK